MVSRCVSCVWANPETYDPFRGNYEVIVDVEAAVNCDQPTMNQHGVRAICESGHSPVRATELELDEGTLHEYQ